MRFYISYRVTDETELYEAALRHAMASANLTREQADEHLRPHGEIDQNACVVMLLDPGISPNGIDIDESGVES